MVALSCCPRGAGVPPNWPAETWAFCAWSAAMTSAGVSLNSFIRSASSQMRIAFCEPKISTSPTPSTRLMMSWTFATR